MNRKEKSDVRVLVVDDNPGTVMATVKYLELSGYSTRGAMSGAQALAEASAWSPDAMILDLGLPDIDGFTVLERARAESGPRAVTFIAVSGRDDRATMERAREAGFAEFLVKPVRLDILEGLLPRKP